MGSPLRRNSITTAGQMKCCCIIIMFWFFGKGGMPFYEHLHRQTFRWAFLQGTSALQVFMFMFSHLLVLPDPAITSTHTLFRSVLTTERLKFVEWLRRGGGATGISSVFQFSSRSSRTTSRDQGSRTSGTRGRPVCFDHVYMFSQSIKGPARWCQSGQQSVRDPQVFDLQVYSTWCSLVHWSSLSRIKLPGIVQVLL